MALSMDELVEMPHLRLAVLAGASGTAETVTWAQASDLGTPWDWATGGELLMKNGRTMPTTADGQVALLRGLAEHDIAGLVIGMDPATPPLHAGAVAVADELRLPVLSAPYSVPFAAIGRAVADASKADEGHRLALTERVYNTIRRSVAQPLRGDAMRQLARDLACKLAVVDADTGQSVLDADEPLPADLRDEVVEEVKRRGGALPGVVHLGIEGMRAQLVEVPDEDATVLVTYGFRAAAPDVVLLQHIATAAALLLAQQGIRREHQRRIGGELLAQLIDGRLDDDEGHRQLTERGLSADRCVLLAVDGANPSGEQYVHLSLDRRGIPNLLLRRVGRLYALVPHGDEAIGVLHRRLGAAALIGVSDPLAAPTRAAAAQREANWAMRGAANSPSGVSHYAQAMLFSVLRDTDEAQLLVDRVLGALLRYDAERSTDLANTLDTFLRCGRSWQATAAVMQNPPPDGGVPDPQGRGDHRARPLGDGAHRGTVAGTAGQGPGRRSLSGLRRNHAAQDVDQYLRLIALHRVPRVLHHVHLAESRCGAGEFGGVLVVDERRVGAAHQRGRRGETGHVVPESLEAVSRAEGVVAPRPGAVVEPLGVVKHAAAQGFSVAMRRGGDGDVEHRIEAGEGAFALDQRDGALLRLGHLGVPFWRRRGDVDKHQPAHQIGRGHRQPQRRQPAKRHPDEQLGVRRELAQHRFDRHRVELGSVVAVFAPGRAAMPRQVDRQRWLAEADDHGVPGVRVLPAAVQEHHPRWAVAELQRADRTRLDALDAGDRVDAGLPGVLVEEHELAKRGQLIVGGDLLGHAA